MFLTSIVPAKKECRARLRLQEKVYLESYRGKKRSFGRNGLRRHVKEAKEGPLELRRERDKVMLRGWGEGKGESSGSFVWGVLKPGTSGEDSNRTFICFMLLCPMRFIPLTPSILRCGWHQWH